MNVGNQIKLIIIYTRLTENKEEKLAKCLIKSSEETIPNINEIILKICLHIILMQENTTKWKKSKEVVKKWILKWLDVGIIYLISNITCMSFIHYVPKIRGMSS